MRNKTQPYGLLCQLAPSENLPVRGIVHVIGRTVPKCDRSIPFLFGDSHGSSMITLTRSGRSFEHAARPLALTDEYFSNQPGIKATQRRLVGFSQHHTSAKRKRPESCLLSHQRSAIVGSFRVSRRQLYVSLVAAVIAGGNQRKRAIRLLA